MARFAKGWQVGQLHPEAFLAFRRWGEAVRLWKKEKGAGAAPLLAEGVLFDCLSRLQGVKTVGFQDEGPGRLDILEARRPARAARAFDAALKIDPQLIEARMRAARIRASEDSRAAVTLETIARDGTRPSFSYLSAISRAALAHAQSDSVTALAWYERALALNPQSTAAAIAISALRPARPLSFDALGTDDLYYSYPCTILTPDVASALLQRIRNVVLK
jgi:tetratricopeptide (TPR) repeat protein